MNNDFNKRKEKIYEHIKKANYKKAFSLSQKLFRDYKDNLIAKYIYASLLGDYAETEAKNNKKMLNEKSRKLLFQLTRQLKGQEFKFSFFVRNEYFYHSAQFKKQFILGNEAIKKGNINGYYSQGVGASNYAYELINKHQKKTS